LSIKGGRSAGSQVIFKIILLLTFSQLKADIIGFLYSLGRNIGITALDISGHMMGNKGIKVLH
jgi:hypothetical protein